MNWASCAGRYSTNYTYFIDPFRGADVNLGTSTILAWLTTTPADAVSLSPGQTVGYKLNTGEYVLYRTPDETIDLSVLLGQNITAPADKF